MSGAIAAAWVVLACVVGCGGGGDDDACVAPLVQPIVGGGSEESFLGLSSEQRSALVYLRGTVDGSAAMCSGVLVGEHWVLTAAHCQTILTDPRHELWNERESLGTTMQSEVHPRLDLMLLETEFTPRDAEALPWAGFDDAVQLDAWAELAGFGLQRGGSPGELKFAVARVTRIGDDAAQVDVEGVGDSGGCDGDSGGPLLQRLATGAVAVVGVLSSGSQSCTGIDTYTQTAPAEQWIRDTVGARSTALRCGAVTDEGRCYGERAVFCEAGQLAALDCIAPRACGFDATEHGFRCVLKHDDACKGVDQLGECRGQDRVACAAGQLERQACGECGAGCVRDSGSGRAVCAP